MPIVVQFSPFFNGPGRGKIAHSDSHHIKEVICDMKLDAWDKNILTLLQRDNRLSQREIAEQVNLSPSAVNRRIAALEEAGIIKGNVSLIDAGKVGRPVTIVVQVVIENERFNFTGRGSSTVCQLPAGAAGLLRNGRFRLFTGAQCS